MRVGWSGHGEADWRQSLGLAGGVTEVNWKGWRLRNVQICVWQLLQNGKGLTGQEGRRERSRGNPDPGQDRGKAEEGLGGGWGAPFLAWVSPKRLLSSLFLTEEEGQRRSKTEHLSALEFITIFFG